MKIVSVAEIKARLSAYLNESRQGPVVVTRNGKAVAVLVAVTDDDELERLVLAHSPKFQALLDKSRRQIEETGGIPHEQFWREVEAERRKADAMTSAATAEPLYAPLDLSKNTPDDHASKGGAHPPG
jgi:prevent-host-death family protein